MMNRLLAVRFALDMGRERRELRARRDWGGTGCVTHDPSRPCHNYAFASPLSSMLVGPSRKNRLLVVYMMKSYHRLLSL